MDNKEITSLSAINGYRSIYIIPKWIYDALTKNGIIDIWNYSNIRPKLAINDIASFIAFSNITKLDDRELFSSPHAHNFKFSSEEEEQEFRNSVLPLSNTEEIADNLRTRLENYSSIDNNSLPYSFITFSDNIFAVLHEGFALKIKDLSFKINFIKDYLKEIYKHDQIKDVSQTEAFTLYLKYCKETKDTLPISKI